MSRLRCPILVGILSLGSLGLSACQSAPKIGLVMDSTGKLHLLSRNCKATFFTKVDLYESQNLTPIWGASGPVVRSSRLDLDAIPSNWQQSATFPSTSLAVSYHVVFRSGPNGKVRGDAFFTGNLVRSRFVYVGLKTETLSGFTGGKSCAAGI
jgi:hypothetical protein